jgi:hypothetical protein
MKKENIRMMAIGGGLGFLLLLNTCTSCSTNKKVTKLEKRIDSLENTVATKRDLEIEGLRASKRTLYDWNAVVRTAVRPDDRMNEYDREIQKLENKK